MAVSTQTTGLLKKLGTAFEKAVAKHANDPTDYGTVRIPPGINNGVAQLEECELGTYKTGSNKGKLYFRAVGTIIEPVEHAHNGQVIKTKGLKTSVMIPLCQTKTASGQITTEDAHVARMMNELRKLGGEEFTNGASSVRDIGTLLSGINEAAPYFKFSTSVRKAMTPGQTEGVWENWHGAAGLEDYVPETGGGVQDDSGDVEEEEAPVTFTKDKKTPDKASKLGKKVVEEAEDKEFDEFSDIDSLASKAQDGDEEAQNKLNEMASDLGISQKKLDDASDWLEVGKLIESKKDNQSEEEEEQSEPQEDVEEEVTEYIPKVGDACSYRPIGKDKKPGKPIECEVTKVAKSTKVVTLKNLTDMSKIENVPWSRLEQA